MTVHIALPRAVNIGAHKKVAMSDLRGMLSDLGFTDVRSLLNSGNLIFRSRPTGTGLESLLETEALERLGLDTKFMVRTSAQWDEIVTRNPFPSEAERDPAHLMVFVCKKSPGKELKVTGVGREVVKAVGSEIYVVYPDGIGRSRLKIDALATARNWNTVLKLAKAAEELGG